LGGPAGDDGPAGRVPRRVVVEAAVGARLRVAARPDAAIDRVDRLPAGQRIAWQQRPQAGLVEPAVGQRGVAAAPAPPMPGLGAQVYRWGQGAGGQQRLGELEQRVATAVEAGVEVITEVAKGGRPGTLSVHAGKCATTGGSAATPPASWSPCG